MTIWRFKLILALLIISVVGCSRIQQIGPDLARDVEGTYTANQVLFMDQAASNNPLIASYPLADSLQIGQIQINKIDNNNVSITVNVNKKNGEILFKKSFAATVSSPHENTVGFESTPYDGSKTDGGTYDKITKIFHISIYTTYYGKKSILAILFAKR